MRIDLQIGDSKTVFLQKEGVGGYNWVIENPDAACVTVTATLLPSSSRLIGGGAVLQVQITALKRGRCLLEAHYRRSWEKQPAKVQQYEIVVS